MAIRGHLDHGVVNSFLRGLRYPLSRERLLELARANDVTGEYLDAFRALPAREYASQAEVMDCLRAAGYALG